MAAEVPVFSLVNGVAGADPVDFPSVGLGCWMGGFDSGERVENMVKTALKHGYRHIDTATFYANEESVGKGIRDSGVPREEIFLTTKLAGEYHDNVVRGFEDSLKALNCEYIDLYLLHWPQANDAEGNFLPIDESPTFVETWNEMTKLLKTGKCRAIGVSNFSIKTLETLLAQTDVVPAVNQVEVHPCLPQFDLVAYCEERGIVVTAYSPIGQPSASRPSPLLVDETVLAVAEKQGATPAQVLISWLVQRGISAIPKSEKEERIKENITLVDLDGDDMEALNEVHTKSGIHRSLLDYHKDGGVFGWTYEELGWNMHGSGLVRD